MKDETSVICFKSAYNSIANGKRETNENKIYAKEEERS